MRVAITHGTKGSATGNWFPWLSTKLERLGHNVTRPQYPTPANQNLSKWKSIFDEKFGFFNLNRDTVLIGHSIGAAFVLRLLYEADEPVKACFLAAGFVRKLGLPEFDDLNSSFISEPFDWNYLRSRSGKVFVYHSDNDPYVPIEMSMELSENLGVKLTLLPNGGHINSDSGFTEFPRLLSDFKGISI